MPWVKLNRKWDERPSVTVRRSHAANKTIFVTSKECDRILEHGAGEVVDAPEDIKTVKGPEQQAPRKTSKRGRR